jgi:hypothetical protein
MTTKIQPISLERYNELTPHDQGFISYKYADQKGWSIPQANPYSKVTSDYMEWQRGQLDAYMAEQQEQEFDEPVG